MGFRESVADFILGGERRRLAEGLNILEDAYRRGPYIVTPDRLAMSLRETDSTQLWDMVQRLQSYDVLYGAAGLAGDQERLRAVAESRLLWKWDVVAQQVIWLWTNFGFGTTVTVTPQDKALAEVWDGFWNSDENENFLADDNIAALSEKLLVDGEFLLVFFVSKIDGAVTLRLVKTDEIVEIVADPEDDSAPAFYKRQFTGANKDVQVIYYPDYMARITEATERVELPDDAVRADTRMERTDVVSMLVAYNRKDTLRGWPIYAAGAAWSRAHTRFREDRASVASSVAMYVNKLKAKGAGQRAVDALKTKLQSSLATSGYTGGYDTNPAAAAGSTFIQNEAADLERMPLGTGASDAKEDGNAMLMMSSMGGGVFPHYMGAGDAYRLATSVAMEAPLFRQWSRYQQFWGSKFRRMLRVVAWAAETYAGASFKNLDCDVSTDRLIDDDLTAVTGALASILRDGLAPYASILPDEMVLSMLKVVWTNVLGALGEADVSKVLKPEWFKPQPEPEPQPVVVNVVTPSPGGNGSGAVAPVPPPLPEELEMASALVGVMKGWDSRMEMVEAELREAHPKTELQVRCPLPDCDGTIAYQYLDHPPSLLVCATCMRTFDTEVE